MPLRDYNKYSNQFAFEYNTEHDYFAIGWEDDCELVYKQNDGKTEIIDLDKEYGNDTKRTYNMMYINDIKKHYNWKIGDVIYLNTKQNSNNNFYIMRGWKDTLDCERQEDKNCFDICIDSDGYVCKRFYNHYSNKESVVITNWSYVIRLDCIYNDYWYSFINGLINMN